MSADYSPTRWKILVVGRDAVSAGACVRLLNTVGLWGLAVDSASEALTLWSTHAREFDLVICDVALHGMLGSKFEQELQSRGVTPRMLFMGNAKDDTALLQARRQVLAKPLGPAGLHQAISQLMSHE